MLTDNVFPLPHTQKVSLKDRIAYAIKEFFNDMHYNNVVGRALDDYNYDIGTEEGRVSRAVEQINRESKTIKMSVELFEAELLLVAIDNNPLGHNKFIRFLSLIR